MYSGYIVLAWFWLQMAVVAQAKLDAGTSEAAYYQTKLATFDFYFKRLPRTTAHQAGSRPAATP